MRKCHSIIIADDDTVFPFGLKTALLKLNKKYRIRIVSNSIQVIAMLEQEKADIVFMDYNMPGLNGAEATMIIKRKFPGTKIIACTYYQNPEIVLLLFSAGIDGYILKEAKRNVIEAAVKTINEGGNFYSEEIKTVIQGIMASAEHSEKFLTERDRFTGRELQIIKLVCEKYSNREIADKLFIAVRTVETHLRNIYKETGTHNHSQLISYAGEHHLIYRA